MGLYLRILALQTRVWGEAWLRVRDDCPFHWGQCVSQERTAALSDLPQRGPPMTTALPVSRLGKKWF